MRRTNHTGRSVGAEIPIGKARNWKMPAPFVQMPLSLLRAPGYAALSRPARKILDFILIEHMQHGGAENGNLVAPYSQLVKFGVSSRDIRAGIEMLLAFHIVECTHRGERLGGRRGASRYRLAWLPTKNDVPTLKYVGVTECQVLQFIAERAADARLRAARQRRGRGGGLRVVAG